MRTSMPRVGIKVMISMKRQKVNSKPPIILATIDLSSNVVCECSPVYGPDDEVGATADGQVYDFDLEIWVGELVQGGQSGWSIQNRKVLSVRGGCDADGDGETLIIIMRWLVPPSLGLKSGGLHVNLGNLPAPLSRPMERRGLSGPSLR